MGSFTQACNFIRILGFILGFYTLSAQAQIQSLTTLPELSPAWIQAFVPHSFKSIQIWDRRVSASDVQKIATLYEQVRSKFELATPSSMPALSLVLDSDWTKHKSVASNGTHLFADYSTSLDRLELMANAGDAVKIHEFGHALFHSALISASIKDQECSALQTRFSQKRETFTLLESAGRITEAQQLDQELMSEFGSGKNRDLIEVCFHRNQTQAAVDETNADLTALLYSADGKFFTKEMNTQISELFKKIKAAQTTLADPAQSALHESVAYDLGQMRFMLRNYLRRDYSFKRTSPHQAIDFEDHDPHVLFSAALSDFWLKTLQPCLQESPELTAKIQHATLQASIRFALKLANGSAQKTLYEDEANHDLLVELTEATRSLCSPYH